MVLVRSGVCVIFNFEYFEHLTPRYGTAKDEEAVKKVFQWLGFHVDTHHNLSKVELCHELRKYKNMDYNSCDAFFCFLLSHGDEDSIYTSDDMKIPLETIKSIIVQSRDLRCKPKVLIIQACRGQGNPKLVPKVYPDSRDERLSNVKKRQVRKKCSSQPVISDFGITLTPEEGEFLMWMATTQGENIELFLVFCSDNF